MQKITDILKKIKPIDKKIMEEAQKRLDSLTKPLGSLGRLEETAKLIVGITGNLKPVLNKKVVFTFAGDHGVTDEGVSAYPKAVTAQMVYNFLRDGAAINVLARHANARVVVADLGVAEDLKTCDQLVIKKIGYGTKNMAHGPAMTKDEAIKSIEAGIDIFEKEFSKGIDIACTGEMGIGNTTAASAITAVFTKKHLANITGRGTGLDHKGLEKKIAVIKQALDTNKPDQSNPIDVLAKVGGFEIGGLAGVILAAAAKKIPVVVDGFISGAAALVAFGIEPKVKDYLIASHNSVESGHKVIWDYLGLKPLLDLNLRLGEGTGAVLSLSIIEASIKILNEMATFAQANVSESNT